MARMARLAHCETQSTAAAHSTRSGSGDLIRRVVPHPTPASRNDYLSAINPVRLGCLAMLDTHRQNHPEIRRIRR